MVSKTERVSRDRSTRPAPVKRTLKSLRGDATAAPLGLDRLIHERVRLAIVSALAVNDALSFNELKELLETTDGNLSVHARKLEEAGYVSCVKGYDGRTPRTEYTITADGRTALAGYLQHMERLIRAVGDGNARESAAHGAQGASSARSNGDSSARTAVAPAAPVAPGDAPAM
jgi:DNA-binding HxlR family transcriptional regulator